jgi:hypothetical protein
MITRVVLIALAMSGAAAAARAEAPVVATPNIYLCPAAGNARWDKHSFESASVPDRSAPLYGGRFGYTPIEAFSAEFVLLTGRNDVASAGATYSVRLTTAEVSMLVNFRTLMDTPVYPFLALGAGASIRRGPGVLPPEATEFDGTHLNFHLGGGVKLDLAPRWGARLTLRDSFFTDTQVEENREAQVTVDVVEVSAGIEYRIPLGRGGGPKRLR